MAEDLNLLSEVLVGRANAVVASWHGNDDEAFLAALRGLDDVLRRVAAARAAAAVVVVDDDGYTD